MNKEQAIALISLFCVALLWTLPFLQPLHYFPMPMFRSEWLAFVLGLGAMMLLATKRAWAHGEIPAVCVVPFGLAAIVLLQGVLGWVPYFGQAVTATYYLLWAALVIIVSAELRRRYGLDRIANVLGWALVGSGLLTALAGTLQYLQITSIFDPVVMPRRGDVYANLAQRNHFGNYVALSLVSLSYLYATRRMGAVTAIVAGAPLVFSLGIGASRSVWLYLAAALILAFFLRRCRRDDISHRLVICCELIVLTFAIDQWLMTLPGLASLGIDTTVNRVISQSSLDLKLAHARSARWMFTQSPVLGMGWGQYPWNDFVYHALFNVHVLFGAPVHNAHNVITHLLAETGLVGALLVLAGAALWLLDVFRKRFDIEGWWLLAIFSVIGIHSLLEYPLWHSYFLGVMAVVVGLGAERFVRLRLERVAPLSIAALLAVGVYNAIYIGRDYLQFERVFAASQPKASAGQIAAMTTIAQRNPVLEPYIELAMFKHMPLDKEALEEKLAANERVMHFLPAEMVVFRHSVLLALHGQAEEARRLFSQAMYVYPHAIPMATVPLRLLEKQYPAEIAPLLKLAEAASVPVSVQ